MRRLVAWMTTAAIVLAPLAPLPAHADDAKVACAAAYEQSQELRRGNHLLAARTQLEECRATCPRSLATDCARWSSEVDTLLPTVRLRALDAKGDAMSDVRVLVDGQVFAERIAGAWRAVDPGQHVFRFERAGAAPVSVRVTIVTTERDHDVAVTFPDVAPTPPPARVEDERPKTTTEPRSRSASYVLGTVGIAALVVGGVLGLKGQIDKSHLAGSCAPRCPQNDVDGIAAIWLAGGISAAIGAVALTAALLLWE